LHSEQTLFQNKEDEVVKSYKVHYKILNARNSQLQ
jgi:hypothetical protein